MPTLADVRIGTHAPTRDSRRIERWAMAVEAAGYDFLGFGDSLWWDPFVSLGLATRVTNRIKLGTNVTNPVTRHPAVIANAIALINELSGGRAVLGIGTGDSAVRSLGLTPAPLRTLERYIGAVRAALGGEPASWDGQTFTVGWAPSNVPIRIAGDGPKTLELAGRTANAVTVAAGFDEDVVRSVRAHLETGAVSAGRTLDDIEIWWQTKFVLAESERAAWQKMAASLAGSAHFLFHRSMEDKFVPVEHRAAVQTLVDSYRTSEHSSLTSSHHAELVRDGGLLDWLGGRLIIGGTPRQILERLEELADMGVTNFISPILDEDPFPVLRELSDNVIGRLPGRTT